MSNDDPFGDGGGRTVIRPNPGGGGGPPMPGGGQRRPQPGQWPGNNAAPPAQPGQWAPSPPPGAAPTGPAHNRM